VREALRRAIQDQFWSCSAFLGGAGAGARDESRLAQGITVLLKLLVFSPRAAGPLGTVHPGNLRALPPAPPPFTAVMSGPGLWAAACGLAFMAWDLARGAGIGLWLPRAGSWISPRRCRSAICRRERSDVVLAEFGFSRVGGFMELVPPTGLPLIVTSAGDVSSALPAAAEAR